MNTAQALGPTHPTPFGNSLFKLYTEAIATNASHARLEIQVPFNQVLGILRSFSSQLMQNSLLLFSKTVWWFVIKFSLYSPSVMNSFRSLRSYQILAINFVLTCQVQGAREHRATQKALLLVVALVWLVNGLHSRPDDGSASRNLMSAILPHVEHEGADPNTLAYYACTDFEVIQDEDDHATLPYIQVCRPE